MRLHDVFTSSKPFEPVLVIICPFQNSQILINVNLSGGFNWSKSGVGWELFMVLWEPSKRPEASYFLQEQEQNGEGNMRWKVNTRIYMETVFSHITSNFPFICILIHSFFFYLMTEFIWKSNDPDRSGCDAGSSRWWVHSVARKQKWAITEFRNRIPVV